MPVFNQSMHISVKGSNEIYYLIKAHLVTKGAGHSLIENTTCVD